MGATQRKTVITGDNGGFLVTRGRPRIATLNGRTYVIGRGKAIECDDMKHARGVLDAALGAEKTTRKTDVVRAKHLEIEVAQATIAAAPGIAPGNEVLFEVDATVGRRVGRIEEVGARSILISHEGNLYRRAPSAVELVP